ncbi:hypothetical protein PRO82_000144 [Candidatus Protochlamydia amoebophila]|nr:hypothetical protein [Candidatus Protochlamydia amoebophila]
MYSGNISSSSAAFISYPSRYITEAKYLACLLYFFSLYLITLRIASNSFLGALKPRFLSCFLTLSMCLFRSTLIPHDVSSSLLRSIDCRIHLIFVITLFKLPNLLN